MAKASKKRECPALGRTISSAECGQDRHSRIACPADCPFNPFSPKDYSQFLEIETHLDGKIIARMPRDFPIPVPILPDGTRPFLISHTEVSQARAMWRLFAERDASGRTWAQLQLDEGFRELKNDERVLFEGKKKTRATLIEIRRIVDDQSVRVLDLLNPDGPALTVVDRAVAGRTARFAVYLTWIYPTPHYYRFSGAIIELPEHPEMEPIEVLQEISRFHGGPDEQETLGGWLAENFNLVSESAVAFSVEHRKRMLAGIDLIIGKVTYSLNAPLEKCRQRLDDSPHVDGTALEEGERDAGFAEARAWLAEEKPTADAEQPPFQDILGTILLDGDRCRLEATSGSRMERLRADFEQWMGGLVSFESEVKEDAAARMARIGPTGNPNIVPPRLLERLPDQAVELTVSRVNRPSAPDGDPDAIIANTTNSWADLSVPALIGLTPREAVKDPAMRRRVIAMVKSQVRSIDERNLEKGRNDDANGLIRELGLVEIDEPPPPPRRVPANAAKPAHPSFDRDEDETFEDEDDFLDPEDDFEDDLFLDAPDKPARVLPLPEILSRAVDHVLDFDEAGKRVQAAVDHVAMAGDTTQVAGDSVFNLIDVLYGLTEGVLEADQFESLSSLVLLGCLALSPPGSRMPPISPNRLESAIQALMIQIVDGPDTKPESLFAKLRPAWRQPELVMHLVGSALLMREHQEPKERLSHDKATIVLLLISVVIDEVDRALWG